VEINPDKKKDEIDYCAGMMEKESGRDMSAPCPIPSLGKISKIWDHFLIPEEIITMAPKYEYLAPGKAAESRNSLWKFGVLSRLLPVTIPVHKPSHEVFFSEDLVRAAIPGVEQSGRRLAVEGLHVYFGAPLAATDAVTSHQLLRMVHRFREDREDPPAFLTESEKEVRREILVMKALGGEEAEYEVKIQEVQAKRRKIITDRMY
jgi:hypothetical protein